MKLKDETENQLEQYLLFHFGKERDLMPFPYRSRTDFWLIPGNIPFFEVHIWSLDKFCPNSKQGLGLTFVEDLKLEYKVGVFIIHNFHIRRSDRTTAAERLFGCRHENFIDFLVAHVRIPGKPRQQIHDPEKRRLGWEKRREKQRAA